jgi:hypothetical protein
MWRWELGFLWVSHNCDDCLEDHIEKDFEIQWERNQGEKKKKTSFHEPALLLGFYYS